jgi:D-alanyl-lipoteichoic acid acyltransferase DltB (MBOAT superfamily)
MDSHLLLGLFHIFAVVPLFLYVALSRSNTYEQIYTLLFVLGIIILLYHGYKAFLRLAANSPSLWINLVHVVAVAPLLIYIGYKGKNTQRAAYELLALVGFAALGYHTYHLILSANVIMDSDKKSS